MASLLYKAQAMNAITDNQARYLWSQYSMAGFKKREPIELDPPKEELSLLKRIIDLYMTNLNYKSSDFAQMLKINVDDFRREYLNTGHLKIS